METPKRTGKILEYQIYRGNAVVVYEYSYRKNKLVKNLKYDEHKVQISNMPPSLIMYKREYDLSEGKKPRMNKTFVRSK